SFKHAPPTVLYTLSLHDALPISSGGFHIDPPRPVERALITHGHSDHARAGHGAALATAETLDLMRLRYGESFARSTQAVRYGERSEEHTSELQSRRDVVCRLLLE